jgi:hypothetical protein
MSIVAFKKKSVIMYGANVSGKPPGGIWQSQGPFGFLATGPLGVEGKAGFSINGGTRNIGYIGKSYRMSKQGTPFRGVNPRGNGGFLGTYATPLPVYNVNEVIVLADQYKYIKPSVLTTRGMLVKKYKWAYNGQYPNYWVQPLYTGNQTDSASQAVYIQNLSAASMCNNDINKPEIYVDDVKKCGPTLCNTSTTKFKFNDMARNAPYTKYVNIPRDSSVRTLQIQRKCVNPTGDLKPFPYAVNGGCGQVNFDVVPQWYINSGNDVE